MKNYCGGKAIAPRFGIDVLFSHSLSLTKNITLSVIFGMALGVAESARSSRARSRIDTMQWLSPSWY